MIKRLIILIALLSPLLVLASPIKKAHAQFDPFPDCSTLTDDPATANDESSGSSVCKDKDEVQNPLTGTSGLLLRAARFMSRITGIASVLIIVYGGVKYATSGGVAASVDSAKNTVLYALVGFVISLMSLAIVTFAINNIN